MAKEINETYDTSAILEKMREEYWRGVTEVIAEEAEDQLPLLTYKLGGEAFGMPAIYAKEILKTPQVVRVPRTPKSVLGIINLRGRITPIIDVRSVLGLKMPELDQNARVIITEVGELYTGMVVEEVLGITQVPNENIIEVSAALAKKDYLDGQVLIDEKPLVILNMTKLLDSLDFRSASSRR